MVFGGDLSLGFELFKIRIQLAQNVFNPLQILTGILQPVLSLATAFFVFGDARSFFEEDAQLFRTCLDDARDHALPDDRVRTRTESCTKEDILHIAAAHRLVVDVIGRGTVARQCALDRDLGERTPLSRSLASTVVKQ